MSARGPVMRTLRLCGLIFLGATFAPLPIARAQQEMVKDQTPIILQDAVRPDVLHLVALVQPSATAFPVAICSRSAQDPFQRRGCAWRFHRPSLGREVFTPEHGVRPLAGVAWTGVGGESNIDVVAAKCTPGFFGTPGSARRPPGALSLIRLSWKQKDPATLPTFEPLWYVRTNASCELGHFYQSGFHFVQGGEDNLLFFGNSRPRNRPLPGIVFRSLFEPGTSLMEFLQTGRPRLESYKYPLILPSTPRFNDRIDFVMAGPNSAVLDDKRNRGWVVAASGSALSPRARNEIFYLDWSATRPRALAWVSLGKPGRQDFIRQGPTGTAEVIGVRPPIIVARRENGVFKLHVFAVFLVAQNGWERPGFCNSDDCIGAQWELWQRHLDDPTGREWQPWLRHGRRPGQAPGAQAEVRNKGFEMTSAIVRDVPGAGSGIVMNVFGHTDDGDLVEYLWTGGSWQWGTQDPPRPQPNLPFITDSSAKAIVGDQAIMSVVGRTSDGAIWERYHDPRFSGGWHWRQLFP